MKRLTVLVLALTLFGSITPTSAQEQWDPVAGSTFQIQLQGRLDTSIEADVYDVDMFDTDADVVAELHEAGRHVVCYVNAGAWENWRPDKDDFPKKVRGKKLDGWPGERWLDIRRMQILRDLMGKRLDVCAEKGFDAADFDNINGYQNPTGFPLKRHHQLAYNRMLAEIAHERELAIGLKNVPELVDELEPVYDFVVNESCYRYKECDPYERFIANDKPVFVLEYELARAQFCDRAEAAGFTAQRKRLSLKAWRRTCWED